MHMAQRYIPILALMEMHSPRLNLISCRPRLVASVWHELGELDCISATTADLMFLSRFPTSGSSSFGREQSSVRWAVLR